MPAVVSGNSWESLIFSVQLVEGSNFFSRVQRGPQVLKLPREDHRVYQTGLTPSDAWQVHGVMRFSREFVKNNLDCTILYTDIASLCDPYFEPRNFGQPVVDRVLDLED